MDVLTATARSKARRRWALWLAPSCAGILGLGSACNALVGVDFGEAHLGEADSGGSGDDTGSRKQDTGGHPGADAHHDAHHSSSSAHMERDATLETGTHLDAGSDATRDTGPDAMTPTPDASHDGPLVDGALDGPHDVGVDGDTFVCDPAKTPAVEPCLITDEYGVFVAPLANGGSNANPGTRAAPFSSIQRAVNQAMGKRVYVCAATYAEQVVVTISGTQIYGGFTCPPPAGMGDAGSAWAFNNQPAVIAPTTVGSALSVQGVTSAHFEDLSFDAIAGTAAAPSSIAVAVGASTGVSFASITAHAGAAFAGTVTPSPSNACPTNLMGGSSNGTTVGIGATCTCPHFGSSTGGNGTPTSHVTTAANSGTSNPATAIIDGKVGTSSVNINVRCTVGQVGANGSPGGPGTAGAPGTLSAAAGWTASVAGAGTAGGPGQGGGGGGSVDFAGSGGGAGGCGGFAGAGAAGGGASIAVAVADSTVTLSAISLQPGVGGAGGNGQPGGNGQAGGAGGTAVPADLFNTVPSDDGCVGGAGGTGGGGGGGGGGAGGPSVGIAWTGAVAPTIDNTVTPSAAMLMLPSVYLSSTPGGSGPGGPGGVAAGTAAPGGAAGPAGTSGAVVQF